MREMLILDQGHIIMTMKLDHEGSEETGSEDDRELNSETGSKASFTNHNKGSDTEGRGSDTEGRGTDTEDEGRQRRGSVGSVNSDRPGPKGPGKRERRNSCASSRAGSDVDDDEELAKAMKSLSKNACAAARRDPNLRALSAGRPSAARPTLKPR